MSLNLSEKITFLNGLVGGTLALTHYYQWELSSYGKNSLFCHQGLIDHVHAQAFPECVDKAFELVREAVANG